MRLGHHFVGREGSTHRLGSNGEFSPVEHGVGRSDDAEAHAGHDADVVGGRLEFIGGQAAGDLDDGFAGSVE